MTSISISNDWIQIVCCRVLSPPLRSLLSSEFHLLPVMKMLSFEQLFTLVGHCVHWIICQVWARFIGSRCCAAALPSTDVDTREASLCHLHNLHGIQSTKSVRTSSLCFMLAHHVVQFRSL